MTDDDLQARLRRLGEVPVDPKVADAHRLAMAEVAVHQDAHRRRFGWKAVAAAAIAGFLVGSTGLAAAGVLPDPAQDVAHDVLDTVGIDVPRSTEGCPEGSSFANHGEYVASVEAAGGDVRAAAHSDCGKPAHAGKDKGDKDDKGKARTPRADTDGDPCTGPPPWAGTRLSPEDKTAAKAEREATCGTEEADDAPEAEAKTDADAEEEPEAEPDVEETTTTTETAPTTTAPPDTTTTTTGS